MSTSHRTGSDLDAAPLAGAAPLCDADAERLSALLDGELDDAQTATASAQWRDDADARARWHRYGLIGDVLRSAELAHASPAGDATFLNAVRERLAHEPMPITVVVQPGAARPATSERRPASATSTTVRQLRRWTTPVGVAAGVLMVAGLAWTLRPGAGPGEASSELAAASSMPVTQVARVSTEVDAGTPTPPAIATVADDPELQPYLRVHRFYAGQSSVGPMPAVLRSPVIAPGAR